MIGIVKHSLMGILPGCLGVFVVVAMFSQGILTIGAVVAAMIATSGDETYVMLSMIPKQTLILTGLLFVIGIIVGQVTDMIIKKAGFQKIPCCEDLEIHDSKNCNCFPRGMIIKQWVHCMPSRGILALVLILIVLALVSGWIGLSLWNLIRVTFLFTSTLTLFIVATVPDHFINEHFGNMWYYNIFPEFSPGHLGRWR